MNRDRESMINRTVRILNEALEQDQTAIVQLFDFAVQVNQSLADHPTIQVSESGKLRVLGLINGLLGIDDQDCGFIAAVYVDHQLVGFTARSGVT